MDFFQISLVLATFLCSLVAGFLFAFDVVIMPGIRRLNDREFIRAFQAIDGVIQNNQPVFMLVWLGSVVVLLLAAMLGIDQLDRTGKWLLISSTVTHLIGVQLPTFIVNIPLNNSLQSLNVDAMDESEHAIARQSFEPRWNRWNEIRTVLSCLTSALLIALVFRF